MRLSKDFTLQELTVSNTAVKHGISNIPNQDQITNLILLLIMPIGKPVYLLEENALSLANGQGIKPSIQIARLETLGHSIVQNANYDAPSNVHSKWPVPA